MNEDLEYTISPARYAKGMLAIKPKPDGSGWKTLAALIISDMPGVRWTHRDGAYLCSPSRAAKFEAAIAQLKKKREIAAFINKAHASGLAIDHIDGNPANNDLANLRAVTLTKNL